MSVESYLDSRAPLYTTKLAISTSATPAIRIAVSGAVGKQTLVLNPSVDCYIRFGIAGVGAATNAYELFKANVPIKLDLANDSTHFSVLGTGSGSLYYYIENSPGQAAADFAGILGSLYVDEWSRDSGVSATQWISKFGRILTNTGSVTYAADGTNFDSSPVIGTLNSGAYMSGTSFPVMVASGSFPYVCGVARFTATSASPALFGIGGATNTQLYSFVVGGSFGGRYIGGITTVTDGAADTNVHFFEIWIDGANLNIAIDGVATSTTQAGATNQDLTAFSVGNDTNQTTLTMSGFHSRYVVASGTPSSDQRAKLLALAKLKDRF